MNLPNDLRGYTAPDAFAVLTPDAAVALICALGILILIFWPAY